MSYLFHRHRSTFFLFSCFVFLVFGHLSIFLILFVCLFDNFCLFLGLVDCDYYTTDDYSYVNLVNLESIDDAQPTGYHARIPVYLIGPRDGHIILSTTNTPNRDEDFVYEFCEFCFSIKTNCFLLNLSIFMRNDNFSVWWLWKYQNDYSQAHPKLSTQGGCSVIGYFGIASTESVD